MPGVPARSSDGARLRLALGSYLGVGERRLPSGEAVVVLHGELDLYGVPEVEKAFEAVAADVPAFASVAVSLKRRVGRVVAGGAPVLDPFADLGRS